MSEVNIHRFENIKGIDLSSEESLVALHRSPKMINMYKDYSAADAMCITTRKGFTISASFSSYIYAIHEVYIDSTLKVIVHSGNNLYLWDNYPSTPTQNDKVLIYTSMANNPSVSFTSGEYIYFLDGANYIRYNGSVVEDCAAFAHIPTTSAFRTPMGEGDSYQEVNVLTRKRKNTFVSNGVSTIYNLNSTDVTVLKVFVDGSELSSSLYAVNSANGTITFTTAPASPQTSGEANVEVLFEAGNDNSVRIKGAKYAISFDNRIFFCQNDSFPTAIFHSKLKDPTYIADTDYYEEGLGNEKTKFMLAKDGKLYVFLESKKNSIVIHTPQIDYDYGKIYPRYESGVNTDVGNDGVNFYDDLVFLSSMGLCGVSITDDEVKTYCRSTLVSPKMTKENDFDKATLEIYEGYLWVLCDGKIYLANSREKYQNGSSFEYEWFYFEKAGAHFAGSFSEAITIKKIESRLLLGCKNGDICFYATSSDDDAAISCEYNTPKDYFGTRTREKCSNSFGSFVFLRTLPNGVCKISLTTDKNVSKPLCTISSGGFSFLEIDFGDFAFEKENQFTKRLKIKEKNFSYLSLRFYSDEISKPFGLYTVSTSAYISKNERK